MLWRSYEPGRPPGVSSTGLNESLLLAAIQRKCHSDDETMIALGPISTNSPITAISVSDSPRASATRGETRAVFPFSIPPASSVPSGYVSDDGPTKIMRGRWVTKSENPCCGMGEGRQSPPPPSCLGRSRTHRRSHKTRRCGGENEVLPPLLVGAGDGRSFVSFFFLSAYRDRRGKREGERK